MWALGKKCVLGGMGPSKSSANTYTHRILTWVCAHNTEEAILYVMDNVHTILRRE